MFESSTTLGDEDLELETSFAPVFSSTQEHFNEKRRNKLPAEDNAKKIKIDSEPSISANSSVNNCGFENYGKDISFSPKVVKRMFPGPAGLPGLMHDGLGKNSELICQNFTENAEDFLFCSQRTVSTFIEGPWQRMKQDFSSTSGEQLYEKFTISWIKKNYCPKKVLSNCKVPFLAAVIQNLETVDAKKIPSVHVKLKDTTGLVDGTMLYSFYKENSKYLTAGSVLVLKQFGVLSTHEGHCLTITSNNLLVIYSVRDPKDKDKEESDDGQKKEHIQKIILRQFSVNDIWNEANAVKVLKDNKDVLININNKLQFSNIYRATNSRPSFSHSPKLVSNLSTGTFNSNSFIHSVKKDSVQPSSSSCNFLLPKTTKIGAHNPNYSSCSGSAVLQNVNFVSNIDPKKKFDFKKVDSVQKPNKLSNSENVVISCSQMSVEADKKDTDIWKTMLEDVDTESLFGDF